MDEYLKIRSENKDRTDFTFRKCDLGKRSAYIRCNGNVLPCAFMGDEWNFGNILNDTLIDIWNVSDKRKAILTLLSGEEKVGNQRCDKECEYAGLCPPGCLASTCNEKGSFVDRDLLWCIKNN